MRTLLCALAAVALAACGGNNPNNDLPEAPQIQPDRVELRWLDGRLRVVARWDDYPVGNV